MVLLTVVSLDLVTVCVVVLLPYVPLTVPYSNHAVVDCPLALTIPVTVAEVDVTFVAEPVVTVGALPALYVTDIVSVEVLPALSFAVTVILLSPLVRLMLETLQYVVPLAVPLPPLSLLHVTSFTPLVLSEALPLRLNGLLVVVYVSLEVGLVMVTMGVVVSRVIESLAALDTFPAESLYHTYTVLLSSPLANEYETLPV